MTDQLHKQHTLSEELNRQLTDDGMMAELRVIHLEACKRTGNEVEITHYDRGTTWFKWSPELSKWVCVRLASYDRESGATFYTERYSSEDV